MDGARPAQAGTAAVAGLEVQQRKHLPHGDLPAHLGEIDGGHGRWPSVVAAGPACGTRPGREEGRVISGPTCDAA